MNQQLINNNYLHVSNFISIQEADDLAKWMIKQEELGNLQEDPRHDIGLYGKAVYNGIPFVNLLVKKVLEVNKLCGEDVLPTYAYSIIYKERSKLIRHTDRDSCEISLSISLQKSEIPWPLWIQKPNKEEVSFNLEPGDAVLYLGCEAEHWRDELKSGSLVQVFLHYVLTNGPRSHAFFDIKRFNS